MTCAVERTEPSSGYVDPDDQPPSTMPYTPTRRAGEDVEHRHREVGELQRRDRRRTWSTSGPNGMTANTSSEQNTAIIGATM